MPRLPLVLLILLLQLVPSRIVLGQETVKITGDRLGGTVFPVEPLTGDISLRARNGSVWTVDDTKRLVLEGDVVIHVANNEFRSSRAVVWINRLPSRDGLINQIAIFFDELQNPTRRSGLGLAGDRLLVTGSARGRIELAVDRIQRTKPRANSLLRQADDRLALHRRRLLGEPQTLTRQPQIDKPAAAHVFEPVPGGTVEPRDLELPSVIDLPALNEPQPWLREPGAVLRLSFGTIKLTPGELENTVTVTDSIVAEYFAGSTTEDLAQLTLSADRAVLFTDPGVLADMATWELDVSVVRGMYLEGNVVASTVSGSDKGEYLVRAPRVYYDFTTDRAIMVDAILRTYERVTGAPIYARAEELRQIAAEQWEGRRIRVTTSEFHTGHFSLGAERMTIARRPAKPNRPDVPLDSADSDDSFDSFDSLDMETHLDARNVTLRAGEMPIFSWPRFSGTIREIPLKSISFGHRDENGVEIETAWDLFSLIGGDRPDGVDAQLRLDAFTKRGAGVGLDFKYDTDPAVGDLELYGLYDDGVDRTSTGRDVVQDEEFRGVALWEHRMELNRDWGLQTQASFISDETFITAWRDGDFRTRREYETSVYLKNQKDRTALTALIQYDLNDFLSNDYLLASTQYTTDKVPEITYRRYGDSIFDDSVTYSGETRVSRMRFVFDQSTPRELGIRGRAFGLGRDDRLSDALLATGLRTRFVNRFDTRHEVSWPTSWNDVQITPFAVARLTAYDEDFREFSPANTPGDDVTRIFGALGVRLNTRYQRIDNSVENRLLDLHRMRHIVEPSATVWFGTADVDEQDLPIYDPDVESLGTGTVVRLGLRNTWQTQRGGPGRWRSVNYLTIDNDLVLNSGDANRESPAAQFFDYRPEYSQFGDHTRTSLVWLLSDALSITGESTIDLDESAIARGSIGAELRHSPILTTYLEFRYLDASDNELLGLGWDYRLTPKYRVSVTPQWDFRADEFRSLSLRVTRSFPDFDLIVQVKRDEIRDDTSIGASIGLVEF